MSTKNDDAVLAQTLEGRVELVIHKLGGFEKVAAAVGLSVRQLHRYISGQTKPPLPFLMTLANSAQCTEEWLLQGTGIEPDLTPPHYKRSSENFVSVPVINVAASAGGGAVVVDEKQDGFLSFSKVWLERQGLNPSELYTLPTVGDSMEPTIHPGDFILCSRAENHRRLGDGIYVIRYGDTVLVKRLLCRPGKVIVKSDNEALYPPYEISMKEDGNDFTVLGKVVMVAGLKQV